jgi:septum formation protein
MNAVLCLASASPRRRELLAQIGIVPHVAVAAVDETVRGGEGPEAYVTRMAQDKAAAVWGEPLARAGLPVLAADTTVVLGERILAKPDGEADARAMLRALSGRTHRVMTAIRLIADGRGGSRLSVTEVTFRPISEDEIAAYCRTGEPDDKAGGYAIQGRAAAFVSHLAGSYSGVMGLPLYETAELLREARIAPPGSS